MKNKHKTRKAAFISTYTPRECGIGTFTHDIVKNLSKLNGSAKTIDPNILVCAISNDDYSYPEEVKFEINQQKRKDYINAANFLNNSDAEIINIQHEFGIFGGADGSFILDTIKYLRKPIVTTFHTVLKNPSKGQRHVANEIARQSVYIIVLAEKAVTMLKDIYSIPEDKIVYIEHGAPDIEFSDSEPFKRYFNAEGRRVMLSFGLINPDKGLEYGIKALAEVVKEYPDILYIILGKTHPEINKRAGEEYRLSLELLVKNLGLSDNVEFFNYFVSKEKLIRFLMATDIYLTPYLQKEQIVSGTLAYALTAGKALISTPYWYAEELLSDNRGILVPFKDEKAISDAILEFLGNKKLFNESRKKAYDFGRNFIWKSVVKKYRDTFSSAVSRYFTTISTPAHAKRTILPEINLNHFKVLTDDTGIFQHSTFTIPNRLHGYSTDDNARALIVSLKNWELTKDRDMINYIIKFLSFLLYAYDENSRTMQNIMNFQREWIDDITSEDTAGRVIWSLGYALKHAPEDSLRTLALNLFKRCINDTMRFTSPRAWAFTVIGSIYYLSVYRGDREIRDIAKSMTKKLKAQFIQNTDDNWKWCEDMVAYENARIPQALYAYGGFFNDKDVFALADRTFRWLIEIQFDKHHNRFSIIGNENWMTRSGIRSQFDQQPVEIAAIIDAAYEGFKYTGDAFFEDIIEKSIDWYLGNNDSGEYVYDFKTGGARDGIHALGLNLNEGAESTLSWLLSVHRLYELHEAKHRGVFKWGE
ncbi:MAG: glycosyltransferase family 4 protein [candidate division WOR-3 bacterium]|nr:glycosyltransferase family 4 protein [candidate division WOR-3 bacterium]